MDMRTAVCDGWRGIVGGYVMDFRCLQARKELQNMEEFKESAQTLIEWPNNDCCPHEKVIVEMGRAVLISEEMGFTFEIPD